MRNNNRQEWQKYLSKHGLDEKQLTQEEKDKHYDIHLKEYQRQYHRNYWATRKKDKKRIALYLTKEEVQTFENARSKYTRYLKSSGTTRKSRGLSTLIIDFALAYINKTYVVPNPEKTQGLQKQLLTIGRNINQIALVYNACLKQDRLIYVDRSKKDSPPSTLGKLKTLVNEMNLKLGEAHSDPPDLEQFILEHLDKDENLAQRVLTHLQKK